MDILTPSKVVEFSELVDSLENYKSFNYVVISLDHHSINIILV